MMWPTGQSALDILNQRYECGEIDMKTYEQMRERLEAAPEQQPASASVPSTGQPALDILNMRYACGEIDMKTYEQIRERLEASFEQQSADKV